MMGIIELIIILFVVVFFASIIGGTAFASSGGNSRSRVDWSKVFMVFVGIPIAIFVTIGGLMFAVYQTRTVSYHATVQAERGHAQAARAQAEAERLIRQAEKIQSESEITPDRPAPVEPPEPIEPPESVEPPEAGSVEFEAEISHNTDNQVQSFVFEHDGHTGGPPESVNVAIAPTAFAMVAVGAVLLGGFFLISRKSIGLAFAMVAGLILVGGTFGWTTRSTSRQVVSHSPSASPQPIVEAFEFDGAFDHSGLIPIKADAEGQPEEIQPLQVFETVFRPDGSQAGESSKTIPDWVLKEDGENVVRPSYNEIVLTSKRYATSQEAEAELKPLATSLISSEIKKNFPQMKNHPIDPNLLVPMGILEKSCQITWPLQVGDSTLEVQQVTWKLDIGDEAKNLLHRHWRQDETSHRLAILGGSLGGLTLLFGAGAMVARRREEKKVA